MIPPVCSEDKWEGAGKGLAALREAKAAPPGWGNQSTEMAREIETSFIRYFLNHYFF